MNQEKQTLREEILEVLDIFDYFEIPVSKQIDLFVGGVDFDYTYGDSDPGHRNKYMNVFEFADFLKTCNAMNLDVDANDILADPTSPKYEELVNFVINAKKIYKRCPKTY